MCSEKNVKNFYVCNSNFLWHKDDGWRGLLECSFVYKKDEYPLATSNSEHINIDQKWNLVWSWNQSKLSGSTDIFAWKMCLDKKRLYWSSVQITTKPISAFYVFIYGHLNRTQFKWIQPLNFNDAWQCRWLFHPYI